MLSAPAARSTGTWRIPRMSGPMTGAENTSFFAMKRTRRLPATCGPTALKMKSNQPVWFAAMSAPPVAGMLSKPRTSVNVPWARNTFLIALSIH